MTFFENTVDPTTMASAVATPLERQFTTITGNGSMTSVNSLGSTQITLQLDLDREIDGAAVDLQTAIAAAMPLLPPGMPSPPSFRKVNPAESPIMFLTLTSETLPMNKVDEYAQTVIAQRLSMIQGVAQVNVMGGLVFSQTVTLFLRPVFYLYMGELQAAVQRLRGRGKAQPVAAQ